MMTVDPRLHFPQTASRDAFPSRTSALAVLNEWGHWGGYTTVLTYRDTAMEHTSIVNAASVYDLCPNGEVSHRRPDAASYLDRLTVRNASKLSPGGVHYTVWCDDAGKVLDDGTLFRHAPDSYLLCCQERHLPWLLDSSIGYDVAFAKSPKRSQPCRCRARHRRLSSPQQDGM